jgi:hypothetical protein
MLRARLGTANGAIKMVCVKSDAVSQGLRTKQGLSVAPSDLWQVTLTI